MKGALTMPQKRSSPDKGLRFLHLRKVVTLAELGLQLHCSPRTVQRRLAEWRAINSYNLNGRYYTLPDIPKFDVDGLWRYRGAFFSRVGNLTQTFVQLVGNAQAGLTAAEVGQLLGLRPSSFLWAFREHPDLKREKHQGLYVYFACDPVRYAQQRQRRSTMSTTTRLPSEVDAVAILVEKIKHPALGVEELSRRLRRKKFRVEPEMVRNLFARHGIAEKKTPHST
jgi:hypothetical protein